MKKESIGVIALSLILIALASFVLKIHSDPMWDVNNELDVKSFSTVVISLSLGTFGLCLLVDKILECLLCCD